MAKLHEVKITMSDIGIGRVWLDDREVLGVTSVSFAAAAGEITKVHIELIPENLEATALLAEIGVTVDDTAKPMGGGDGDG